MKTEYAEQVGGRCARCCKPFVRVSRPSKMAGLFAFVRVTDELGRERCAHVTCAESIKKPVTRDYDHFALAHGTARKPAAE